MLNTCIATLTKDEQEVIWRRYYAGQTLTNIAEQTGINYNRVRQLEHKGLQKLRRPANRKRIFTAVEEAEFISESTGYSASGLQRFRDTWYSSVELAYERIEAMRMGRSLDLD